MKITRREFLGACSTMAVAGWLGRDCTAAFPTHSRPNIVLILTDDMDLSFLGCYGGKIPTPHLDALARDGMRCDEGYCVTAVCAASRYSVLTGQYPQRCNSPSFLKAYPVTDVASIGWQTSMQKDTPSIARMLGHAGYLTGFTGKWGIWDDTGDPSLRLPKIENTDNPDDPAIEAKLQQHQAVLTRAVREQAGFDYASAVLQGNLGKNYPPLLAHHNIEWHTEAALNFIRWAAQKDKPFFLMVTPTAVHGPDHVRDLEADPRYTFGGKLAKPLDCHPPRATIRDRLQKAGQPVTSESVGMTFIDDQVGAITSTLRELKLENNTLFVFVADNGIEPGKSTCYQKGVHLPMLIKWPMRIKPGATRERVQYVDILPTFLAAASTDAPDSYRSDGVNLLPLLLDGKKLGRSCLYFERGTARAILRGHYKYVAFRLSQSSQLKMREKRVDTAIDQLGETSQLQADISVRYYPGYFDADQLYDLSKDPNEQHNLAADPAMAGVLQDMQAELAKVLRTFRHPFDLGATAFLNSETYKRLVVVRRTASQKRKWWNEGFQWSSP